MDREEIKKTIEKNAKKEALYKRLNERIKKDGRLLDKIERLKAIDAVELEMMLEG